MPSRATLTLALLVLVAGRVVVERPRSVPGHTLELQRRELPAVTRRGATRPSDAEEIEGLSQSELERRLDQLERELSAGSPGFPSSRPPLAEQGGSDFGLD